jgi:hypothetical protein
MGACGHCGFKGPLDQKGGNIAVEHKVSFDERIGEYSFTRYWLLYRCPACDSATLEELWWSDEWSDGDEEARRIYPTPRDNTALPDKVRAFYDAALSVKKIEPGLYAVAIRRMLEAVCNDMGVTKGDLYKRLTALADQGHIPGPLGEMAQQLRKLGNFGAHDMDVEVGPDDVPIIEDFADAILEYVYRAPAKVQLVVASLAARRGG